MIKKEIEKEINEYEEKERETKDFILYQVKLER